MSTAILAVAIAALAGLLVWATRRVLKLSERVEALSAARTSLLGQVGTQRALVRHLEELLDEANLQTADQARLLSESNARLRVAVTRLREVDPARAGDFALDHLRGGVLSVEAAVAGAAPGGARAPAVPTPPRTTDPGRD